MDDGTWNDWPAATNREKINFVGCDSLKKMICSEINSAVASGCVEPDEAFGVLMFVASSYVAKIEDAAARAGYVKQVCEDFGTMVDLLRASDDRLTEAMAEAVDATRQ